MKKDMCFIFFIYWITSGQTQEPVLKDRSGENPIQVVVKEDSDAVLPCSLSTKENMETKLFVWKKDGQEVFLYNGGHYYGQGLSGQDKQFEGRVSHFNEELKNGNASIKIRKTKMADSGFYTCILPRLKPPQNFTIELVVEPVLKDRSGENPTASLKPYIEILPQTEDRALLQCEVTGASPEPELEWRDSSGNILHAVETQRSFTGGKYDIILQTTVTKTDTYSCVLTQEEIHHEVTSQMFVYMSEKVSSVKDNNGWHEGLAVGLTVGLAVGVMFLAAVEALSLWCFPSLRNRVFDFLRRLQPRREEVIQMDPETARDPEQNHVNGYHDDPGSHDESGLPLKSSNVSTH